MSASLCGVDSGVDEPVHALPPRRGGLRGPRLPRQVRRRAETGEVSDGVRDVDQCERQLVGQAASMLERTSSSEMSETNQSVICFQNAPGADLARHQVRAVEAEGVALVREQVVGELVDRRLQERAVEAVVGGDPALAGDLSLGVSPLRAGQVGVEGLDLGAVAEGGRRTRHHRAAACSSAVLPGR